MPSKLKKAIGAVKDQTSISLAKVVNTNSSNLEVAVLKATTREEEPIDERYVHEILQTISSNKVHAAICAHCIAKRIGKTKNWVVALKSLMLVLRIFQDGDPFFPNEVLQAKKRGAKILNLSTFRDDSNSSPYDYTAFVRAFAFYLEERLDCFLTGKLQRRFTYKERQSSHPRSRRVNQQPVREMKPPMLLDRISYWQRLLDRAIATKPVGAARSNRLVQASFHAVVRESFDLYRDISDGLGLLLDGFFHLQHQSCVNAFQYCVKASKQFEELSSFYDYCKGLGIGRTSEYPSVQKISEELMDTLQEFLKDQASFPSPDTSSPKLPPPELLLLPAPEADMESQAGSTCTSLEDLMMCRSDCVGGTLRPSLSVDLFPQHNEKQFHEQEDHMFNVTETGSNHSLPIDQRTNVTIDFVSFDDWPESDQIQGQRSSTNGTDQFVCTGLELALIDAPGQSANANANSNANDHCFFDNWLEQDQSQQQQQQASQNEVKCLTYIDDWLQDNQQANSHNVVNGNNSYFDDWLQEDKKLELAASASSSQIVPINGQSYLDDWFMVSSSSDNKEAEKQQQVSVYGSSNGGDQVGWELAFASDLFDQKPMPQRQYNPFLDDGDDETDLSTAIVPYSNDSSSAAFPADNSFSVAPTFQATPTFLAHQSSNEMVMPTFKATPAPMAAFQDDLNDPFAAPWPGNLGVASDGAADQQNVMLQQELWLQNQNKIMARHIV